MVLLSPWRRSTPNWAFFPLPNALAPRTCSETPCGLSPLAPPQRQEGDSPRSSWVKSWFLPLFHQLLVPGAVVELPYTMVNLVEGPGTGFGGHLGLERCALLPAYCAIRLGQTPSCFCHSRSGTLLVTCPVFGVHLTSIVLDNIMSRAIMYDLY